jgi:hypothetical protein
METYIFLNKSKNESINRGLTIGRSYQITGSFPLTTNNTNDIWVSFKKDNGSKHSISQSQLEKCFVRLDIHRINQLVKILD